MKKVFALKDLDCANCAQKMEDAIARIKGVKSARVSFLTQKLTLEAEDALYDQVVSEAVRVCKKIEPDCRILL